MKVIKLTQNQVTFVDDVDFDMLVQFKWYAQRIGATFYAARRADRKVVYMHALINGTPNGLETDHIDGNGLNNQKHNLRPASHKNNLRNQRGQRIRKGGPYHTIYKGAYYSKARSHLATPWVSYIELEGKTTYLGVFETDIEAAKAYNGAATKYYGEYARLNLLEALCSP